MNLPTWLKKLFWLMPPAFCWNFFLTVQRSFIYLFFMLITPGIGNWFRQLRLLSIGFQTVFLWMQQAGPSAGLRYLSFWLPSFLDHFPSHVSATIFGRCLPALLSQLLKCMLLSCQSTGYHPYSEYFGLLSVEALALNFHLSIGDNGRGVCYINISLLLTLLDGENLL